jgi:hypothetical protein
MRPCAWLLVPAALGTAIPFACATGDPSAGDSSSEATSGEGAEGPAAASSASSSIGSGGEGGSAVASSSAAASTAASTGSGHPEPDAGEDAPPKPDLPDLIADAITRDALYYYVEFCNVGTAGAVEKFTVLLTNTNTNQSFESNPLYPFDVPPPGMCMMTGGFTCGLIGDSACNLSITVKATVDPQQAVVEADEGNNEFTVAF